MKKIYKFKNVNHEDDIYIYIMHNFIHNDGVVNFFIPGFNRTTADDNNFYIKYINNFIDKNSVSATFDFYSLKDTSKSIKSHLYSSSSQISIATDALQFIINKLKPKSINIISMSYGAVSHINILNNFDFKKIKVNNIFSSPVINSINDTKWFQSDMANWGNDFLKKDYIANGDLKINDNVKYKINIINGYNDTKAYVDEGEQFYNANKKLQIKRFLIPGNHGFFNPYTENLRNYDAWEIYISLIKILLKL